MATINRYVTPVQNTLEQYVPLPFDDMLRAGQIIQQRGDLAEQQQMQVQTGLSSMEALAPAHAQFRNQFANSYREQAGSLLDKYQGNTSNPEFIRDMKRLNTQYANDPRLQVVKQANDVLRQNQQIAAKLRAEGKLFLQPQFTGVDERGNLTSAVGGIEAVNTLEEWNNRFKVAHDSMEDVGMRTTNKRNLDKTRKLILEDIKNGGPESTRLMQAYMQQGLSPERARQAVVSNLTGLTNQYGVVDRANTALMNYGLQSAEFAYRRQRDQQQLDLDRYKAQTARQKAQGSQKAQQIAATPSFNEFQNRVGSIGEIGEGDNRSFLFGSGYSQYGTSNKPIKNQRIGGKIYDVGSGSRTPESKTINISDGTLKGYVNAWVDKKTGKLLETTTPTSRPRIEYRNGKPYAFKDGKPYEVEERTLAEYNYNAGTKDQPELKTFYKAAAPKEAMKEMGYSNAYYEGMGRTQHGNVFDSNNRARLDYNFIKSNITRNPDEIRRLQDAEKAFNQGTATDIQRQYLEALQSFDTRETIYNNEILPYFENQGKSKSIVN